MRGFRGFPADIWGHNTNTMNINGLVSGIQRDSMGNNLVGGLKPSEKYEFVNWDDYKPNIYGKIKNVPNHQPAIVMLNTGGIIRKQWTSHGDNGLFMED